MRKLGKWDPHSNILLYSNTPLYVLPQHFVCQNYLIGFYYKLVETTKFIEIINYMHNLVFLILSNFLPIGTEILC